MHQALPGKAMSPNNHDKLKCLEYLNWRHQHATSQYGFEDYGCGFCQSRVPCGSGIPIPNKK